jgi:hypothetical protein
MQHEQDSAIQKAINEAKGQNLNLETEFSQAAFTLKRYELGSRRVHRNAQSIFRLDQEHYQRLYSYLVTAREHVESYRRDRS